MLKQRILTAIPLAALVVWGMLTQPENIIFYALLVLILISGWEWARLSGIKNNMLRGGYAILISVCSYFAQQFIYSEPQWLNIVLSITVLAWLVATYHMFSKGPQAANDSLSIIKLFIGFIVLIPPVLALLIIRAEGVWCVFFR